MGLAHILRSTSCSPSVRVGSLEESRGSIQLTMVGREVDRQGVTSNQIPTKLMATDLLGHDDEAWKGRGQLGRRGPVLRPVRPVATAVLQYTTLSNRTVAALNVVRDTVFRDREFTCAPRRTRCRQGSRNAAKPQNTRGACPDDAERPPDDATPSSHGTAAQKPAPKPAPATSRPDPSGPPQG